jgi:hypothetical protein
MKLLPNFAGHKADYPLNFRGCDIYLDPFVGNGGGIGHAIRGGCKTVWIAEKELSMVRLWNALNDGDTSHLESAIVKIAVNLPLTKDECRAELEGLWRGSLVDRLAAKLILCFIGFNGLTRTRRHDPDELWISVYPEERLAGKDLDPEFEILSFFDGGDWWGITPEERRSNLMKRLHEQFKAWRQIAYVITRVELRVFEDCYAMIAATPELPKGRVGALIDPPYFLNKLDGYKTISPSYQGHQPYADFTWELCEDVARAIVPIAQTVYLTNYHSRNLDVLSEELGLQVIGDTTLKTCGFHAKKDLVSSSGKAHRKRKTPVEMTLFKGAGCLVPVRGDQLDFFAS